MNNRYSIQLAVGDVNFPSFLVISHLSESYRIQSRMIQSW